VGVGLGVGAGLLIVTLPLDPGDETSLAPHALSAALAQPAIKILENCEFFNMFISAPARPVGVQEAERNSSGLVPFLRPRRRIRSES
jgi:hypothetical protein